jgi:hypothetical protein
VADVQEAAFNASAAAVTLTTTSEAVVISAPRVAVVRQSMSALAIAIAQLTTGTATTTVTPRIRRGTLVTDPLVGEANAITIGAAAGGNEQFIAFGVDELSEAAGVEYSLTLQQASATGNGTVLAAMILVLLF